MADFITLRTENLFDLMSVFDDPDWFMGVFMAGVGRCHDFKNIDGVKQHPHV